MTMVAWVLMAGPVLALQVHAQPAGARPGDVRPPAELRAAIKQVNDARAGGGIRLRKLSPAERAELRRQLSQHSRLAH